MKIDSDDLTDCGICKGTRYLQKKLGVFEEGFGKLEMCECHPDYEQEPDPEPPDDRDLDLSWIEYTE